MKRLFHVSEDKSIKVFVPRPSPAQEAKVQGDAVWAVDADHLAHYLLPQDCPRIALRASPDTTLEDRAKFFPDGHDRVIAVEFDWYTKIRNATVYIYELPVEGFTEVDAIAGYSIARQSVVPTSVIEATNLVEEIVRRGYKLRLLPNLWPLYDSVLASTIQYSIFRMRNAKPR
ncbi:MAG: DUF6886 family protein [Bdellovibrionales bacterium]